MIFNFIFKRSLSPTLMQGEDVEPAHQLSDREDVPCDVCHGNKAPSVKSCLVCQASYCEIHLVPHQRDPALQRHRLTDPAIFNTSHLCRKHNKPLTMFCKQDHTPVCSKCTEGDHKHHKIVPMEKESRRVKVREKLLPLPFKGSFALRVLLFFGFWGICFPDLRVFLCILPLTVPVLHCLIFSR